jgi:N utilization substance protein B
MTRPTRRSGQGDEAFRRARRFGRECALQFLYQLDVQREAEATTGTFDEFWKQISDLEWIPVGCDPEAVCKFAARLSEGVCEAREKIDAVIVENARNWRLGRMSAIDRNILRLATYEILCCEDIPALASIDEAVELAKEFGDRDSWRFVNGILDQVAKLRTTGT